MSDLDDGTTPCPHCDDSGRVRRYNPSWDPGVYAKMKKRVEDGEMLEVELGPYKHFLLEPCPHCEKGKELGKRITVRSTC